MKTLLLILFNTDVVIILLTTLSVILLLLLIANLLYVLRMRRKHHLFKQEIDALKKQHEPSNQSVTDEKTEQDDDATIEQELFLRLDKYIEDERLYCDPTINRDTLCRLIGVDKNRLGNIITRYSGSANSTAYISGKRMKYAVELMREHPEWTMMRIAEMCGISNTSTFNRVFRQTYGMTPTEYMKKERI